MWWSVLVFFISGATACGYPGSSAHVKVTFSAEAKFSSYGEQWGPGTIATYSCDPGFQLLGRKRRQCAENGTWIPTTSLTVCAVNVAEGKAPMQSSTVVGGVPQRAVDGATSRIFSPDSCTMTDVQSKPWWYVNLLEPFFVQLVQIDFGRPCCGNKPVSVIVTVGNNRPDEADNPVCNNFTGRIEEGRPLYLPCRTTLPGAFVKIQLENPAPVSLSICEVFVYTDRALPVQQCPTFPDQLPDSTATYNGKCYVFYDSLKTFSDAERFCELRGGSLIDEISTALQGFFSWELYSRYKQGKGRSFWMGLSRDPHNHGNWKWVNGRNVTISFFKTTQLKGNCSRFDGFNNWLWSEVDCNTPLGYICQHKPVTCGTPGRPSNSSQSSKNFKVDSVVEYECGLGHLLVGPKTRSCLPSGYYEDSSPLCRYLECGFPAKIPSGTYNLVNGTRYYLSQVEYSCEEGKVLVGRGILVCDVDQKWNGPPPRCDPAMCHLPPTVINGNITLSIITNSTAIITTSDYSCHPGYKVVGKSQLHCSTVGTWDGQPPVCEEDPEYAKQGGHSSGHGRGHRRNRSSISARINMGGIIALGVFGGFVFLAVIISIIVIIVRRNVNLHLGGGSMDSFSMYGSKEKLKEHTRHEWSQPSTNGHPRVSRQEAPGPSEARGKGRSPPERVRDPMRHAACKQHVPHCSPPHRCRHGHVAHADPRSQRWSKFFGSGTGAGY